jgi:hypothetical protein
MLYNFRRYIAERFMEDILDEDFAMGIREGMARQSATLRIRLDYNRTRQIELGMTKTQLIGYDKAVEAVDDYTR